MAVTTNMQDTKRRGRFSFGVDDPKLREQFFGYTTFPFGEEPQGPSMAVQVFPANLDFATHYHDTDYCTIVLQGDLRVGRNWYRTGDFRVQDEGSVYGPVRTGPDGCVLVSFYGDRTAIADQFKRDVDRERNGEFLRLAAMAFADQGIGAATAAAPAALAP